ncbi:6-phosphofructokinase [Babesia microti strain RI]|uniref:Probable ATP-dependent 6-phosphofructokinase n=1 Tax=Babesia microti (strain RI) TaxID=1133968 RepID=A0A1R4AAN6_BABMR|nr:6-phosphofructokinase [Babesia microti strain RI]SJK86047.1 6-phosphofructokinase [Babesia microti strain RI]|eukprot:XP_021338244.1 6-phosphofructokinase [Babesia microti strain RI]
MASKEEKKPKGLRRVMSVYSRDNQHWLNSVDENKYENYDRSSNLMVDTNMLRRKETLLLSTEPATILPGVKAICKGDLGLKLSDEWLYRNSSTMQINRRNVDLDLPPLLKGKCHVLKEYDSTGECENPDELKEIGKVLSNIIDKKMVLVEPFAVDIPGEMRRIKIGLILSGGPAPGGHCVISGAFDYLKIRNPDSKLIGFIGGIDGFLNNKYEDISSEKIDNYRNMGGFDMLWSGRGRIKNDKDLETAAKIATDLELDGLIIIGGDGSNSNAALLANYFEKLPRKICVVGVPKTIDGDVKSENIEQSFGFDTASRTYSELIGNLCVDATSTRYTWHFVRVMGRSASHLALECAMQTHPNILLVGEEIQENGTSLEEIVHQITDLMIQRMKLGKNFGVILISEGLIEFIPEVKILIQELNEIVNRGQEFDVNLLNKSRKTWEFLPYMIQEQLLLDREASGYIMVAKIATERLLLMLVESYIASEKTDDLKRLNSLKLQFMPHYFGYEGRCAVPSDFDATYCYSLGYNASLLISHDRNGYMSVIRNLAKHYEEWVPMGLPFVSIMHMVDAPAGSDLPKFPAIKRVLVDLNSKMFKAISKARITWALSENYRSPGPLQLKLSNLNATCLEKFSDVPNSIKQTTSLTFDSSSLSNKLVHVSDNLDYMSERKDDVNELISQQRCFSLLNDLDLVCKESTNGTCYSPLQNMRLNYKPNIPPLCKNPNLTMTRNISNGNTIPTDTYTYRQILLNYPHLTSKTSFEIYNVSAIDTPNNSLPKASKVGIVCLSKQYPGIMNVIWGVRERLKNCELYAFQGTAGLINGVYSIIKDEDLKLFRNQGGLGIIYRSRFKSIYPLSDRIAAANTCIKLGLHSLVIMGDSGAISQATLFAEYLLSNNIDINIIGVPVTGSNCLASFGCDNNPIEACVGFDTNAKLYAGLVGNVLTDAASIPKYWHFVKILGRLPSLEVLEVALQTHPNVVIIAEEYGAANKTLFDVVRDIADAVCQRAEIGKNFGTVLIPDHLIFHLPSMKTLIDELRSLYEKIDPGDNLVNHISKLSSWNKALFESFPEYIRKVLYTFDPSEILLENMEIEILLANMVKEELNLRKKKGLYKGNYLSVTHYFGYQGRCSLPTNFDSNLGFAYGHIAGVAVESNVTGVCVGIQGLCTQKVEQWEMFAVPFVRLLRISPDRPEIFSLNDHPRKGELPLVLCSMVNLSGKSFRALKEARGRWVYEDLFCNPGPIQYGEYKVSHNLLLQLEHAEYWNMLALATKLTDKLKKTYRFGVSEDFLRHVLASLSSLLLVANNPGKLISILDDI